MEPESSLPHSQVPATCPYPEPTPSSPQTPSHFLKIHLNIILPSTSGSPQWSLSLRFPYQHPVHTSPLPHTRHMPRPSYSARYYHPHDIGLALVHVDENEYNLRAINIAKIQNHKQALCYVNVQTTCKYLLVSPPCCEVQSQTT
jgi:hypothetical protein